MLFFAASGMQILFVPERHHWVLSSCTKGDVCLYDSASANSFPSSLQLQIVQLYKAAIPPQVNGLLVECTPVQQQEGKYDCGLFAVAFAYHLAVGDDIKTIQLQQHKIRNHLMKCFEKGRLSRFPRVKREHCWKDLYNISIDVYCPCCRADCWGDMVACSGCNTWFHMKCVHLRRAPDNEWFCKDCKQTA